MKRPPNSFRFQKKGLGARTGTSPAQGQRPQLEATRPHPQPHLPLTPGGLLVYVTVLSVFIEFTRGHGVTRSPLQLRHNNAELMNQFLPHFSSISLALTALSITSANNLSSSSALPSLQFLFQPIPGEWHRVMDRWGWGRRWTAPQEDCDRVAFR